mgnify:CR=1 FL=1
MIRITLEYSAEPGSWSEVGTDATNRPAGEPTMNFTFAAMNKQPHRVRARFCLFFFFFPVSSDLSPQVLHEFGHALGLLHEHQRGDRKEFKQAELFAHLRATLGWDDSMSAQEVYKTFTLDPDSFTEYDPLSIMHYSFPAEVMADGSEFALLLFAYLTCSPHPRRGNS